MTPLDEATFTKEFKVLYDAFAMKLLEAMIEYTKDNNVDRSIIPTDAELLSCLKQCLPELEKMSEQLSKLPKEIIDGFEAVLLAIKQSVPEDRVLSAAMSRWNDTLAKDMLPSSIMYCWIIHRIVKEKM